jgi:hypothetical protein
MPAAVIHADAETYATEPVHPTFPPNAAIGKR